jgi:regulation of enolase protein 1 (concanavalin A-like superfamily)
MKLLLSLCLVAAAGLTGCATIQQNAAFQDDFNGRLAQGWTWLRERPSAWRVGRHGLELRVLPGNMWGPANDAANVLIRPLPDFARLELEISVTVENHPTQQYEQANLVWYYDDANMVKLGQELVDGKLSVVMGREERDQTRMIAIMPLAATTVRLRLCGEADRVRGEFQLPGQDKWTQVGECDLPAKGEPKASLQVYQGPRNAEHWACFTAFRIAKCAD